MENVLALRGDPPKGATRFEAAPGGFQYASELVDSFGQRDLGFLRGRGLLSGRACRNRFQG